MQTPQENMDQLGSTLRPGSENGRYYQGRSMFGGRYVLERSLGIGGMGSVWLVKDATGKQLALKLFNPLFVENGLALARRETRAGQNLDHPNIIHTHILESEDDEAAVVMEFIDGRNLYKLLMEEREGRPFAPAEILPWIEQLCAALDYAHKSRWRVIHRDVKPQNLIVEHKTDHLKVGDFGISRVQQQTKINTLPTIPGADTTEGNFFSMGFTSPEQISGDSLGAESDDVFSVGATLFYLITATLSYQTIEDAKHAVPPLASERRKKHGHPGKIEQQWDHTIAACLAKDPAYRPKMAQIPKMLVGTTRAPRPPKPPSQTPKSLILVLVSIIAAAAWYIPQTIVEKETHGRANDMLRLVDEARAAGDHLKAYEMLEQEKTLRDSSYTLQREWTALQHQSFDWKIAITPADAEVVVPTDAAAKLKSGVVRGLKIGHHEVTVRRNGYRPELLQLPVGGARPLPEAVTLQRLRGSLVLSHTPHSNAVQWTVRSETLEAPDTPITLSGAAQEAVPALPTGTYKVIFKRPDWPEFAKTVTVRADETTEVHHVFKEAVFTVSSRQAGAEFELQAFGPGSKPEILGKIVRLGDRLVSRPLPTGNYVITGRLPGFPPQIQRPLLDAGDTELQFNWSVGSLRLSSNLPDAKIYDGDRLLGVAKDLTQPIPCVSGLHNIRAEHPDVPAVEIHVNVAEGTEAAGHLYFLVTRITLTGSPAEADIYEGERRVGHGLPLALPPRPIGGNVTFRIEAAGYAPRTVAFEKLPAGDISKHVQLIKLAEGWFTVTGLPPGATVILHDGKSNAELERATLVEGGTWKSRFYRTPFTGRIEAQAIGYKTTTSETLTAQPSMATEWAPEMTPTAPPVVVLPQNMNLTPLPPAVLPMPEIGDFYKYRFQTRPAKVHVQVGLSLKGETDEQGWYESTWVADAPTVTYTVGQFGYESRTFTLTGKLKEVVEPAEGMIVLQQIAEHPAVGTKLPKADLLGIFSNALSPPGGIFQYGYIPQNKGTSLPSSPDSLGIYGCGIKGIIFYSGLCREMGEVALKKEGVRERHPAQELGEFYDIWGFDELSSVKLFSNDTKDYYEPKSGPFHFLNNQACIWASQNLIPSPNDIILGKSFQQFYKESGFNFARMMVLSRIELRALGEVQECAEYRKRFENKKDFDALEYFDERFTPRLSVELRSLHDVSETLSGWSPWSAGESMGFWMRRLMDGSEPEVWRFADKFMRLYDKEWYLEKTKTFPTTASLPPPVPGTEKGVIVTSKMAGSSGLGIPLPKADFLGLVSSCLRDLSSHMFSNTFVTKNKDDEFPSPLDAPRPYTCGINGIFFYTSLSEKTKELAVAKGRIVTALPEFDFGNVSGFEDLAALKVFSNGNKPFYEPKSGPFHFLNKQFVAWASENFIPSPEDLAAGRPFKQIYKTMGSNWARMMVLSRLELRALGEAKECAEYQKRFENETDFNALEYFDKRYISGLSKELRAIHNVAENSSGLDPWAAPESIGFWMRRLMDGSEPEVWKFLDKFMRLHDRDWYLEKTKSFRPSPPDLPPILKLPVPETEKPALLPVPPAPGGLLVPPAPQ